MSPSNRIWMISFPHRHNQLPSSRHSQVTLSTEREIRKCPSRKTLYYRQQCIKRHLCNQQNTSFQVSWCSGHLLPQMRTNENRTNWQLRWLCLWSQIFLLTVPVPEMAKSELAKILLLSASPVLIPYLGVVSGTEWLWRSSVAFLISYTNHGVNRDFFTKSCYIVNILILFPMFFVWQQKTFL